jgi:hypothetical protein
LSSKAENGVRVNFLPTRRAARIHKIDPDPSSVPTLIEQDQLFIDIDIGFIDQRLGK